MKQHRPRVNEENYTKLERYTGDSFDDRLSSLLLLKSFREQELDNLKTKAKSDKNRAAMLVSAFLIVVFIMVMQ